MSDSISELEELLVALSRGSLDESQRSRLEALVQNDAGARAQYLDSIAVDAMLRFRAGGGEIAIEKPAPGPESRPPRAPAWLRPVAAIAACVLFGVFVLPKLVTRPPEDSASSPVPAEQFMIAGWSLRAAPGSDIEISGPAAVELISGELYAAPGDSESPIEIQTKSGTVAATGSRFHVEAMKMKPLTRLFVIAGAAVVLSNPSGSAEAAPGEIATAEGNELPKKLLEDGNYREAYDIYKKLVVDPEHGGEDCAQDLRSASVCLRELGRHAESDALLEEVVKSHPADWRVLAEVARRYWESPHNGVILDNQFVRAGTGGQPVDVTERDRIRSLQLAEKAMGLLDGEGDGEAVAGFYRSVAGLVQGGRQLWNLQALTDIQGMPDLGDPVYWSQNAAPPVDENDTPIYYGEPATWGAAKNDGERWRWLLAQRAKVWPDAAAAVKFEFANFLHGQFGVHTSGTIGSPQVEEGKWLPEGRYTTHTLSDAETIARLATGVKRLELPGGQRFIELYREIADIPLKQAPSPLRDLSFKVYAGEWTDLPEFAELESVAEGKIASQRFDLAVTERRDHFGMVFEGKIEIPQTGQYTFEIQSDDGSRLLVGGREIVDSDGRHNWDVKRSGKVKLEKGSHPLRLEYFEHSEAQALVVTCDGPGMDQVSLSTMRRDVLPQERALAQLAHIFENRRQLGKAAKHWEENIERFAGHNLWKIDRLEQIVGNWARLLNTPVFTAGEKAVLDLQFRNATKLKLRARKVDIEKYIADTKTYMRSDPPKLEGNHGMFNVGWRIVHGGEEGYLEADSIEWTRELDPADDHWTTSTRVETPLDKTGVYLVEATAEGGNTTRVMCWITDTAIVMKRGDQQHVYYVADAVSGAPLEGANVEIFAYYTRYDKLAKRQSTKTVNFSRFTDADGMMFTDADDVDDAHFRRVVIARDEKSGRFGILGDFFRDRLRTLKDTPYVRGKAWCATDRPVYRPGQDVHVKAWVRQARYDLDNVSLYGGREFILTIRDPSGKEVLSERRRTDEFGGLDLDWKLGSEAMLGSYKVRVMAENWPRMGSDKIDELAMIGSIRFRVEEYKKPEYEVTVDAPDEPAVLGESIEATIKANYYFGAPVANAQVKYTVRRTSHADSWFPRGEWDWFYGPGYWWWGYDYAWYPGWGRWGMRHYGWFRSNPAEIVQENTVPIGKDGTVKIKIDTATAKERFGDTDHRYEITAEVVDESRRTITGIGSVIAARHPFNASVWMNGGHFRTGAQMAASIRARTPDGKGVKGKGTATLYRVTFGKAGKPVEAEVGKWEVETDADGRGTLAMEAGAPGQYRLAYVLRDAKGREREGAALTRIRGDEGADEDGGFRFDALELVLDKAEYAPGDHAQLLINTERADSTVALFIRPADGVYPKPIIMRLAGKSTVVPIPIALKDMPNIHVEAFTIAAGQLYNVTREIIVPPVERVLSLAVEPSEETYQPGAKAEVKLRLTDAAGKPFSGTTVVAIYDKSLEAIAASQVIDIRRHFWKWSRRHSVRARFSLSHQSGRLARPGELQMADIGTHWPRWNMRGRHVRDYGFDYDDGLEIGLGLDFYTRTSLFTATNFGEGENRNWSIATGEVVDSKHSPEDAEGESVGRGSGVPEAPVVRSRFADTALWKATVDTDANGIATIELEMPENLTTWKIKAWAMGHGTRVGHGEAEVITSKDVMIRLQAPRFFTQNDEVVLSANVHNYTGAKRSFDVALELGGGQLELIDGVNAKQKVEVDSGGDQRVNWIVRAVEEGQALVRVATTTEDGKGDAMEQRYPVFVHGILKTDSFSLALRDDQASEKIEVVVPEERRPDQTHLEVRYSPSIALSLVDALPHLARHRRKNSESTINRFAPLVITQKILQDIGVDLEAVRAKAINFNPQEIGDAKQRAAQWLKHHGGNPIFDNAEVEKLVELGLRDLTGMQNADGGWGWYKGHDSSAHMTAYVMHALQVAEANGVALVPGLLTRGIGWLEKHQNAEVQKLNNAERKVHPWKSAAGNTDAFVFMVLTDADRKNAEMADFLYRDRLGLTPYCMAMAALAYDRLAEAEKRDMIIRNLSQFLEADPENQTARLALRNRSWSWYWYGNDIEANAYYLKLLCRTGKAKGATASGIAKYLLNNRKHATYWHHTRDTAVAIEALAEYVRASGEMDPDLEVEVLVDGNSHKKVKITKDNLFSFDGVLELRGDALKGGKHTVEIRRKGRGKLYANAYMTNFTLEDRITKAGLEIKVERRYYKLVDVDLSIDAAGSRGQVVGYKVEKKKRIPLADGAQVKSGDLIEVELLLDSKNDYEYLQFSDRKPAGFEVIGTRSGHRWLGGVSAYMELRDERVDFFTQRLRTGKHSLTYRLRAEVPGKFSALPASGVGVYAPELRANSDEFKVSVAEQ